MSGNKKVARICIFCGQTPQNKNREHPLPQWLLRLTGDPNRVVQHGIRWLSQEPIRFSYSSLTFPSCERCNARYATMEAAVKPVVEAICAKEPVHPEGYVLLLDWLDKVRIGMWLGHRYLQDASWFEPTFTIDSRVAKKDRMVAVYPIGDQSDGLNTYGVESMLFQRQPSAFAIRINGIVLVNASWDWMCASRCGFPYPQTHSVSLDIERRGMSIASNFRRRNRVTHPIMDGLAKASVLLFQPIVQVDVNGELAGVDSDEEDRFLSTNQWPNHEGAGPLFRQYVASTARIGPTDAPIEFDSILARECRPASHIFTQAYDLQNRSFAAYRPTGSYADVKAYEDLVRYSCGTIAERCTPFATCVQKSVANTPRRIRPAPTFSSDANRAGPGGRDSACPRSLRGVSLDGVWADLATQSG